MSGQQLNGLIAYQIRKYYYFGCDSIGSGEDISLMNELRIESISDSRLQSLSSHHSISELLSFNQSVLRFNIEMKYDIDLEGGSELLSVVTPIDSRKCGSLKSGNGGCAIWESVLLAAKSGDWSGISESEMRHLDAFTHCDTQQSCVDGSRCAIFQRMEAQKSNSFSDRLHLILFTHPPRANRGTIRIPKQCH